MEGKGEEVIIDDDDDDGYLFYDQGEREGERDKKNKGSRDNSHFTPGFQCRQTIFCALVSSLFHLLKTTKFIHFVQDLVAYNRRNDGLTDPARR